ncbi:hypothetical protein EOV66_15225 [Escherichia coli]|nr:hypothetical protein EOV66_15225 [Escherichia coli]
MEAEDYAVIDGDGNIVNVIVWDGVTEWEPPEGTQAVRCGDNLCVIGGTYKEGVFNGKRLVRTVLIFTESSDQLSRATDRVPGLPASPGYVQ